MGVVADEEVRSAFFRTLSSNRAGRVPGNKATTLIIMQTTAFIPRTAQSRPLSSATASVRKALASWLNAKSELFTIIAGFSCTRRQVLRVYSVFGFMGLSVIAAETNIPLSLLGVALAAYNVRRLNQEDDNQEEKGGKQ